MKRLALAAAALLTACDGGTSDPDWPNPGEPNGTFATATDVFLGDPVLATMDGGADYDFYALTLAAGATVRIRTFDATGAACDEANGGVDTFVEVFDAAQARVAWSDDSGPYLCEDFLQALPAGTSYVAISTPPGYGPFIYTLLITAP